MATSDFWQSLAVQFQALRDLHGTLGANWHYIVGSGVVGNWEFSGSSSGSIRGEFEVLARHGASEIPNAAGDLLTVWLEALRDAGYGLRSGDTGTIYDVCEASANFCRKLESSAVQTQFDEKHLAIASIPTPIPSEPKPDTISPPRSEQGQDEERERRGKLLAEYKAATKVHSNRKIYEATNSEIHKPQFYRWVKGTLPVDSATTVNFERFLREKKLPIPRNAKD